MSGEALGAILGYTGSLIGAAAQTESVRQTNQANRELAQYQFETQKQLIQEQNEYNSPLNQMKRYTDAGLNPNLIYGNISEGNQNQVAKYEPPTMQAPQIGSLVSNAVNAAISAASLKADLDLKRQERENLREEQFRIRAERHAKDIDNMWNALTKGFDPGLVTQAGDLETMKSSIGFQKYDAEVKNLVSQVNYRQTMSAYYDMQKEVASLTKEQKDYYNREIQPLMKEIMQKRRDGLDESNEILKLQRKFFTADRIASYGNTIASIIARFVNPFGGGSPAPYSNWTSTPSW